ncbi:MAG: DUF1330 domain-containing protein [Actinomycetales bacterium]
MSPVYAINLFNVADEAEYLAYARRSPAEVARHNGKVIALGEHAATVTGDLAPRRVFILVEWASRADFDAYRDDPELADLHPHREQGTSDYLWLLYDKLTDLRGILGR